jgi:transcriptional regulator with XRE-family HTH domain
MISGRTTTSIKMRSGELMPQEMSGSTVPRRQLGRYLEDLRENAGLNRKDAAKALERSAPTLWRIETGRAPVRGIEVDAMCRLYGATPEMTQFLTGLASETKAKGWWQAYGEAVPDYLDLFVGLEAAASRLSKYESELIPGLFQTQEYARTIITADHPEESEAEIERRVQLRLARQAILRRPIDPPALQVAIRESILRCPVGGPAVMAPQLARLAEAARLPHVSLRVLPFTAGFHLGMLSGAFSILRFPLNGGGLETEPPTVYSDLYTGALYLDKPHEVARYDRAFAEIWDASLDEDSSANLVLHAAEELRNG